MSESVQPDLDDRTLRAATQEMCVEEKARALFEVTSESGRTYTVDLREGVCSCPDFEYRDGVEECKHLRRVRIEVNQVDIEALQSELASRATDLQADAEQLEDEARKLDEQAREIENALDSLQEVAR
ncbi:hypothetical protein [Saliphagus infecundisoli]|uniref:SWIM-type domain-containing protein n=1 Tax=Saliphagus infecundisoli TaxID=1849069 RepID=A0ABD5QBR7_9EURY|nr:hypothetical protein [Saliphagus infecundisoli]